eukprot:TRINITY_DN72086_c0_g1_i1.p1 TRINITY_DN72086_c0_g1~~TRINITY_DN72086_c0_g1_i1.p1  ORF type:complete len:247 (+),score=71.54 TRINITY_DN72086_c0_g1_i1:87-743(+)
MPLCPVRQCPAGGRPAARITLALLEEESSGENLVDSLSTYLECSIAAAGPSPRAAETKATVFDAAAMPHLSVRSYVNRIALHGSCCPATLVLAAIYVERAARNLTLRVTSLNVHRLLLAGFVLAAKWHEDRRSRCSYFAEVGGVPLAEMNRLESEMLTALHWHLLVEPAEYEGAIARHRRAVSGVTEEMDALRQRQQQQWAEGPHLSPAPACPGKLQP